MLSWRASIFGERGIDAQAPPDEVVLRLVEVEAAVEGPDGILVEVLLVEGAVPLVTAHEMMAVHGHVGLVEGNLHARDHQVVTAGLGVDQHGETAACRIADADIAGGRAVQVDAHQLAGEGLADADRVAAGQERDLLRVLELAGALALPAERAQQAAVRPEDLDLHELGIQDVEVAFGVGQHAGDDAQQDLVVILAAAPPELLEGELLDAVARFGVVHDVDDPVLDGGLGGGRRPGRKQQDQRGQQGQQGQRQRPGGSQTVRRSQRKTFTRIHGWPPVDRVRSSGHVGNALTGWLPARPARYSSPVRSHPLKVARPSSGRGSRPG